MLCKRLTFRYKKCYREIVNNFFGNVLLGQSRTAQQDISKIGLEILFVLYIFQGEKMKFYTKLEEAGNLLKKRVGLRQEVEAWWKSVGLEFPTEISGCGILGKDVMPRIEFFKFYEMCQQAQLNPFIVEFEEDKFVSSSKVKMSLACPMMLTMISKKGFPVTQKKKLLKNIQSFDGRKTLLETGLLEWHRKRMDIILPDLSTWDMSNSAKKWKELELYYQGYLSVCVAHGVLFEDYHGVGESGDCLSNFTERAFEPAFKWLKNRFGVLPVIVKLPWKESYRYHPSDEILKKMSSEGGGINLNLIKTLL